MEFIIVWVSDGYLLYHQPLYVFRSIIQISKALGLLNVWKDSRTRATLDGWMAVALEAHTGQ